MINPTRCSAVIVGNVIVGSDDNDSIPRDKCYPVLINNLIYDCRNAGIAVENSCETLLVNNTIVDCGRGLLLFDLGRQEPPYRLNPDGGTTTVVNCVIQDYPRPITLNDSSNEDINDRGSHITIRHCNIESGQDGISVSGTYSTLSWQEGNMDIDPQFTGPDMRDYHLRSEAGRWNPNSEAWYRDRLTSPCIDTGDPNSDWTQELWSHGQEINLGAFGGTPQASMSPLMISTPTDLNNNGIVNTKDLRTSIDQWLKVEMLLSEDINRDEIVNLHDFALFASDWL